MEKKSETDGKVDGLVQRRASKLTDRIEPVVLPVRPRTNWIWLLSVTLLMIHVVMTVVAGQTANIAFLSTTTEFHAPFLFVFFKTLFRGAAFPVYITINTTIKLIRGRKLDLGRTWRRCALVLGPKITWKILFIKFAPTIVTTIILQVSYALGLANLTTSLASALATPAVATSYLMTWWFLKHPLSIIKILFVFISFGGVALVSYDALQFEPTGGTILGVTMMFVSDISLSSYQLLFKKTFPKGDLGQISFAVSGVYLLTALVYLPIPIILKVTGVEHWTWSDIPFPLLIVSWSCTGFSALVYGYGLTISSGFFMGLSDLLVLTINTGVDSWGRDLPISTFQIIGTVILGIAFIVMIMPDKLVSVNLRRRPKKADDESLFRLRQASPELAQKTAETPRAFDQGGKAILPPYETVMEADEDLLENQNLPIQDTETQVNPL
ncbi:hypothetical protein RvY_09840 [Ramazzottius varieornatus]|uniref:EamA domain-containing protein n=1 Tax=Ramazzottius varieornatus TaxID=947166 RepID=A0A1D1VAR2_RAMVA|nr:hypothetical protein RvY_09840 [Ramazzottius varieornatus]